MGKIKIFLVDDHVMVREGIKLALTAEENIKVIGEAGNGEEAIQKIKKDKPDIILMDINMPGKDGITTAKEIKKLDESIKIIILTMFENELYVLDALKNKIEGFIYKDSNIEELLKAIDHVSKGKRYFNEDLTNMIFDHIAEEEVEKEQGIDKSAILTSRQIEIIKLAAKGMTSRQIADKLFLSELTVIKHRKNIIKKLSLKNFTEVVSYSLTNDII